MLFDCEGLVSVLMLGGCAHHLPVAPGTHEKKNALKIKSLQ
jgi:hypothetical protein